MNLLSPVSTAVCSSTLDWARSTTTSKTTTDSSGTVVHIQTCYTSGFATTDLLCNSALNASPTFIHSKPTIAEHGCASLFPIGTLSCLRICCVWHLETVHISELVKGKF